MKIDYAWLLTWEIPPWDDEPAYYGALTAMLQFKKS